MTQWDFSSPSRSPERLRCPTRHRALHQGGSALRRDGAQKASEIRGPDLAGVVADANAAGLANGELPIDPIPGLDT